MSEFYAHLYRIPLTGLRFFTVYGPWGRPRHGDVDLHQGHPGGETDPGVQRWRDAALDHPPKDDGQTNPGGSVAPHFIYNIGNNRTAPLGRVIDLIEQACGKMALRDPRPMQPGDVPATYADIKDIRRDLGYEPTTSTDVGIPPLGRSLPRV